MPRKCSVPDCPNDTDDNNKKRSYRAPAGAENREPWIKYLRDHGVEGDIPGYINICEDHFQLYELKDGTKYRYYKYPTIPKSQWFKGEAKEISTRPTYFVKVDMDALNSGDVKNVIQNVREVHSAPRPPKISKIEFSPQCNVQQSKPPEVVDLITKNISTPKVFTVPTFDLKHKSTLVMGNFKVTPMNATPKAPQAPKTIPTISNVTSLSSAMPKRVIPRKIVPQPVPVISTTKPPIPKVIMPPKTFKPISYKTASVNFKPIPIRPPSGTFKQPSGTFKPISIKPPSVNFKPISIKPQSVNFKSITLGPKVITIAQPPALALAVDPLSIKKEPEEPSRNESNFRIEAVHENFQEATEVNIKLEDESEDNFLNVSCSQCPMSFSNKSKLLAHEAAAHKKADKPKAFGCSICSKKFLDKKSVLEHEKAHDPQERTRKKCKVCSEEFWTLSTFLVHLKIKHGVSFDHLTYLCILCLQAFDNLELLAVHKRAKHMQCPHCNEKLKSFIEISRHILQSHTKTKPPPSIFKCDKCPHTTISAILLAKHQKIHQSTSES